MSLHKKDLLKFFESFSDNTSAENLNKGLRRLLLLYLIESADDKLHPDLDGYFFLNLEGLFDLLDEVQDYQSNKAS
jgi:hypothetical protein